MSDEQAFPAYETLVRLAAANERLEATLLELEKAVIRRADWIGEQLGLANTSLLGYEVVMDEFRAAVDRKAA